MAQTPADPPGRGWPSRTPLPIPLVEAGRRGDAVEYVHVSTSEEEAQVATLSVGDSDQADAGNVRVRLGLDRAKLVMLRAAGGERRARAHERELCFLRAIGRTGTALDLQGAARLCCARTDPKVGGRALERGPLSRVSR